MQCMQQVVRSNRFTFVSSLSEQAVNKVMLSVGFEQFINLFCIYTGSWIKYMNIEVLGKNVLFCVRQKRNTVKLYAVKYIIEVYQKVENMIHDY